MARFTRKKPNKNRSLFKRRQDAMKVKRFRLANKRINKNKSNTFI